MHSLIRFSVQILVRGTTESTNALSEYCQNHAVVDGKVFTPHVGEIVDATTESHIYQVGTRAGVKQVTFIR